MKKDKFFFNERDNIIFAYVYFMKYPMVFKIYSLYLPAHRFECIIHMKERERERVVSFLSLSLFIYFFTDFWIFQHYFMKLCYLTYPAAGFLFSGTAGTQISRLVSYETGYKATKEPLYRGQTRRYL